MRIAISDKTISIMIDPGPGREFKATKEYVSAWPDLAVAS
jgi:hypothetical protein